MRPLTPDELLQTIVEIFPTFLDDYLIEALNERKQEGTALLHFVMLNFMPYFSRNRESFSEKQLKAFGVFINGAVAVEDNLENAVSTCFLEHLRQTQSYKTLAPFLSNNAKKKTHA